MRNYKKLAKALQNPIKQTTDPEAKADYERALQYCLDRIKYPSLSLLTAMVYIAAFC